jgi:hypothetical protein
MQTRPGAGQISSRQTLTGAAQTFVGRHAQVQDKSLLDGHAQVQHRLLSAARPGAGQISSRQTCTAAAQTLGDRPPGAV